MGKRKIGKTDQAARRAANNARSNAKRAFQACYSPTPYCSVV